MISVVGAICQERARAASHCIQMQTAGSSGAIMYESLENGSVLLIIPESAGHEWAAVGRAISGPLREQSLP